MLNPRDITNVEIKQDQRINFNSIPKVEYDGLGYDLMNPKDYNKYIAEIKKIVRGSIEYKDLVNIIKDMYFKNESGMSLGDNLKTELHHTPIVLEDIVELVYLKNLDLGKSLDVLDIAREVTQLHYFGLVGLYNLNRTEHGMIHNNLFFVPISHIWGDVETFMKMYENYTTEYQKECFEEYLKMSREYDQAQSKEIINKEYFDLNYIKVNNNINENMLNNLSTNLNNRINDKYSNKLTPLFKFKS